MNGDLTTLANVKGWLGIPTSSADDDALLTRLITAQSRNIQAWLNRLIASQAYTEVRDGLGAGKGRLVMMFNNYPVTAVQSLTVNGFVIPASPDGAVIQPGYSFDANQLWVAPTGYISSRYDAPSFEFTKQNRNVVVKYTAGFLVMPPNSIFDSDPGLLPAESQVIPGTPYQLRTLMTWLSDNGVWDSAGTVPLVKVTGTPTTGQYAVSSTGLYTFAAADVGKTVLFSYSYVPPDIEQGVIELIGVRYKEKDRIGIVSKSVGTENISYLQKDMPADVQTLLNQYRKVYAF